MKDLVNYVCVSLIYGPRLQRDSGIRDVLARVKNGELRFSAAMKLLPWPAYRSDAGIFLNGYWTIGGRVTKTLESFVPARRHLFLFAVGGFLLLNACEAKDMRVVLDLVVFSYLDRPIFEVNVDGKGDEVSGVYPRTGKSTTTGVEFNLGPKKVTWRLDGRKGTPRNGEVVQNKNPLELTQVLPGAQFLAVHIYPDDTVELVTSVHFPHASARGDKEIAKMDDRHGK